MRTGIGIWSSDLEDQDLLVDRLNNLFQITSEIEGEKSYLLVLDGNFQGSLDSFNVFPSDHLRRSEGSLEELSSKFPKLKIFQKKKRTGHLRIKNEILKYFVDSQVDHILLLKYDNLYFPGFGKYCSDQFEKKEFFFIGNEISEYCLGIRKSLVDKIGFFIISNEFNETSNEYVTRCSRFSKSEYSNCEDLIFGTTLKFENLKTYEGPEQNYVPYHISRKVTFVTALLNLSEDRTGCKSDNIYIVNLRKLASTGIQLCVYTSEKFEIPIREMAKEMPNVRIMKVLELPDLDTYKKIMNFNNQLKLPKEIHPTKDTSKFMILMNSKIEFVHDTMEKDPFETEYFCWIDAGIYHVFYNPDETTEYLKFLGSTNLRGNFFTIPGCWQRGYKYEGLFERINWRFGGGFFLGSRDLMEKFYKLTFEKILEFLKDGYLSWEVNFWAWLEQNSDWNPHWFLSDHTDEMIQIPPFYFSWMQVQPENLKQIGNTLDDSELLYLGFPELAGLVLNSVKKNQAYRLEHENPEYTLSGKLWGWIFKKSMISELKNFPSFDWESEIYDQYLQVFFYKNKIPIENIKMNFAINSTVSLMSKVDRIADLANHFKVSFDSNGSIVNFGVLNSLKNEMVDRITNIEQKERSIVDDEMMLIDLRKINFFIINMASEIERKSHVIEELEKYGIKYVVVEAIKDNPGFMGCTKSHMKVIEMGLETGLPFVVIEDDISFVENPKLQFQIPKNTDVYYIGLSSGYDTRVENFGRSYRRETKNYGIIEGMQATHGILYLSEIYAHHSINICKLALSNKLYHDIILANGQKFFNVRCDLYPIIYQDAKYGGHERETKINLLKFSKFFEKSNQKKSYGADITAVFWLLDSNGNISGYFENLSKIQKENNLILIGPENEINRWRKYRQIIPYDTKYIISNDDPKTKAEEIFGLISKYQLMKLVETKFLLLPHQKGDQNYEIINPSDSICIDHLTGIKYLLIQKNRGFPNNIILDNSSNIILLLENRGIFENDKNNRLILMKFLEKYLDDNFSLMNHSILKNLIIHVIRENFFLPLQFELKKPFLLKLVNKIFHLERKKWKLMEKDYHFKKIIKLIKGPKIINDCVLKPQGSLNIDKINFYCRYLSNLRPQIFVESGTFLGGTISNIKNHFQFITTIEISPMLFGQFTKLGPTLSTIVSCENITFYRGDSKEMIKLILSTLEGRTVFFLDGITSQGEEDWPLIEEICEIDKTIKYESVIICNNYRLFETNINENYISVTDNIMKHIQRCKVKNREVQDDRLILTLIPPKKLITGLIFSKDNPLQLEGLIESLKLNCKDIEKVEIHVLYMTSDDTNEECYEQIIQKYPDFNFQKEYHFESQVINIISRGENILFLNDNTIFIRNFRIKDCLELIKNEIDVLGLSLKLGYNTTYCTMFRKENQIPTIVKNSGKFFIYNWKSATGHDFNYSLEINSSIYRSTDILEIIGKNSFQNLKDFEDLLNRSKYKSIKSMLGMYKLSRGFSIPYNMVNIDMGNFVSNNKLLAVNELFNLYVQGYRMCVSSYKKYNNIACHELIDLYVTSNNLLDIPKKIPILAPSSIPKNIIDDFTMGNKIPVIDSYFNEKKPFIVFWNDDYIEAFLKRFSGHNVIRNLHLPESYHNASAMILEALSKYTKPEIKVAIIGSETPWIESLVYNSGIIDITTVHYNDNVPVKNKYFHTISYENFKNISTEYDLIITYSAIQHFGLGRYGNELSPNEDIIAMKTIYSKLKFNGFCFWGAPVGKDRLLWNAHRIYGEIRLPLLFNNFNEILWIGHDRSIINVENQMNQPIVVLGK